MHVYFSIGCIGMLNLVCPCFDFANSGKNSMVAKMRIMSKELVEAVRFICTVDFWIMAVLWTFSLLASYLPFFSHGLFVRIVSYPRNANVEVPVRPLCIITGVR